MNQSDSYSGSNTQIIGPVYHNSTSWLMHTALNWDRDRIWETMGFYVMLCTVHTTQGQGQGQGTIVSIVPVLVPLPVPRSVNEQFVAKGFWFRVQKVESYFKLMLSKKNSFWYIIKPCSHVTSAFALNVKDGSYGNKWLYRHLSLHFQERDGKDQRNTQTQMLRVNEPLCFVHICVKVNVNVNVTVKV